ncbi:MAG: TIGR02302 family protein [Alphaproteobacteria bacterium]|nr:TIGR02302 family protein [Alphaproteobacteria bacterium]
MIDRQSERDAAQSRPSSLRLPPALSFAPGAGLPPSTRVVEARARLALIWERLWPALLPALLVTALALALALSDWLPDLPTSAHIAVLVITPLAILAALIRGFRGFHWPDVETVRRRVERASGVAHRPIETLRDQASSTDPVAVALFRAHQKRVADGLGRLSAGLPQPGIIARDPYAVRVLVLLVLVVGIAAAGREAPERLSRALSPDTRPVTSATAMVLDVWVTPPAFTGQPPIFAASLPAGATIQVPVGSRVTAQISGTTQSSRLLIGTAATPLAALDGTTWRGEATIDAALATATRLALVQTSRNGEREVAAWPLTVTADHPPTIALTQPPQPGPRGTVRVEVGARDDFGIDKAGATLRFLDGDTAVVELPLALASRRGEPGQALSGRSYQGTLTIDLTTHPWAGSEAQLVVHATDAAGQTGRSDPVVVSIPERPFTHPVARAIVEQRRDLVRTPVRRDRIARVLARIASQPRFFNDDVVVFLGLTTAAARLRDPAAIEPVQGLLWDLAVRLEEGDVGLRERELRAAEQALLDALARNAPDAEIQRLMEELRQAMDRFLESMIQEAMRQPPSDTDDRPIDPDSRMITRDDLQRMLDQARELMRQGRREEAMALLNQLREMMQNLRTARPQQGGDQQAREMMRNLEDLARRQQELMDQTFRENQQRQQNQQGQRGQQGQRPGQQQGQRPGQQQGQQGQRPGQQQGQQPGQQPGQQQGQGPGEGSGRLSQDQQALRERLGDIMRQFGQRGGQAPEAFGRADRAMRNAERALEGNDPGSALGPQSDALEQLREAGREMADQMQQQAGDGQGDGEPGNEPGQRGQQQRQGQQREQMDPFGRRTGSQGSANDSNEQVGVTPGGTSAVERARGIFDELLRRSQEPGRPRLERDYLERLLNRF